MAAGIAAVMAADSVGLNAWVNGLVLSGLGLGVVLSVRERLRKKQWRHAETRTSLPSPLSHALARLVGTAGGIYLSLELMFSFLGLHHEDWQNLMPLAIDPIAAFSLVIAIVQPYAVTIWTHLKRTVEARSTQSVAQVSRTKSKTKVPKRRL
ncbi:MAG: hypothetical protein FWG40_02545 [Peptococcaceae bacterium]|nr:hypothetical protein [Peptococcaceae bacterium]